MTWFADRHSTASSVAHAAAQVKNYAKACGKAAVPVVAVAYMGSVGRRVCEEAGVSWMDLSGNGSIVAPGVRILVEGRPNRFKRRGRPSSVFAPKSSRVARQLLQWLQVLFRVVVAEGHGTKLLAPEDLADVLRADNRADLFVAGAIDPQAGIVVLFRGDLQPLVVPLSWFKPTGEGTTPDPTDFEVIDGGTAIRMGDYEASARSILYDLDPVFRRRAKKLLVERDDSFGGALRRLRLLRGLPRSAFEPEVTEKEVARIELGHVKKPRTSTVKALAAKLEVEPDELASY